MSVIKQIYELRRNFLLIGLTGRTGSGCTTVADILKTEDFNVLKSKHKDINDSVWDNDSRKSRIVYKYMREHWHPFISIKASDVIYYYALKLDFDTFVKEISTHGTAEKIAREVQPKQDDKISNAIQGHREEYKKLHELVLSCDKYIENFSSESNLETEEKYIKLITKDIPKYRKSITNTLQKDSRAILSDILQRWGNNIRRFDAITNEANKVESEKAPACLARKINRFIKLIRKHKERKEQEKNKNAVDGQQENSKECTHIVIDALRNPYEILYFRERYSSFYLMSINTDEQIRKQKLVEQGFDIKEIDELDKEESAKRDFRDSYSRIDINKCIELSDIHITHNGEDVNRNRELVDQILTYLSLMRHPGLVPPSPIERTMQIAYTAKLNSGCLSRQVGAVVTNNDFSVRSIGWNTVPQGQTPCNLRTLVDLYNQEDDNAYSNYERSNIKFKEGINNLYTAYRKCENCQDGVIGLPLSYCFKDIHNVVENEHKNQVHTRSLHAEENAILQLSKYGSSGIQEGKLFTTSSCCELCGKKAYQLGIKEIYYIDDYPGITRNHIIECGTNSPQMILFHGAIGRAYISLFNQFLPLKDEIEALTGINPKEACKANTDNKKEQLNNDTN